VQMAGTSPARTGVESQSFRRLDFLPIVKG
jgi:hypothetical protein